MGNRIIKDIKKEALTNQGAKHYVPRPLAGANLLIATKIEYMSLDQSGIDIEYVFARATYYPTRVKLFIPNIPIVKGFPNTGERHRKQDLKSDEQSIQSSINRTKNKVRDIVWTNRFELFATFTFKSDREDIFKCKSKMAFWLKHAKKLYPDFKYLIVPEFHHDGKALHFHALMKGYGGEIRRSQTKTGRPRSDKTGKPLYHLPSYQSGFSDVQYIEQTMESQLKVGNYVRKYILKDMPLFYNKNRYWVSKGVKRPPIVDNPSRHYLAFEPDFETESPHGKVKIFTRTPELRELESENE